MTPINQMKSKQIKVILYGTEDVMKFSYEAKTSDTIWEYTDAFEGVLNNLQRKFMETDSESKREWLKQFMRDTPCLTCQGRKLKPEALAVKINSKNIMEVCDLSIDSSYEFFNKLELTDTEQFIARDILKEIKEKIGIFKKCWTELSFFESFKRNTFRRRITEN